MATHPIPGKLTFDEYLAIEGQATYKSEYRAGEMFAMAGGADEHSRLASRLIYLLQLKDSSCRVYTSDMMVYVEAVNESMYPDVMAICGQPKYYRERIVVTNPTVLIEVLSPGTADYDKGLKAQFYRQIPSLQVLLLVDSETVYAQTQTRQPGGTWKLEDFSTPEQVVTLDRWSFSLTEIYAGILLNL